MFSEINARSQDGFFSRKQDLVDIANIAVDPSMEYPRRIAKFISDVKDPYLFRVGDVGVRVRYIAGESLHDVLAKSINATPGE